MLSLLVTQWLKGQKLNFGFITFCRHFTKKTYNRFTPLKRASKSVQIEICKWCLKTASLGRILALL